MENLTRSTASNFVFSYFSDHFHMPQSYFSEKTNLRDDLLYTNESLVELGRWINQSNWHSVHVMPGEVANCQTIGDVIDLIWKKAN